VPVLIKIRACGDDSLALLLEKARAELWGDKLWLQEVTSIDDVINMREYSIFMCAVKTAFKNGYVNLNAVKGAFCGGVE